MSIPVEPAPATRTIRPIRDQVLVKQDKPKEKLASGLFVPQGHRDAFEDFGTVIAVGPGRISEGGTIIAPSVAPGDRVLFKRRPASSLEDMGPEFADMIMLKDDDILAVVYE